MPCTSSGYVGGWRWCLKSAGKFVESRVVAAVGAADDGKPDVTRDSVVLANGSRSIVLFFFGAALVLVKSETSSVKWTCT